MHRAVDVPTVSRSYLSDGHKTIRLSHCSGGSVVQFGLHRIYLDPRSPFEGRRGLQEIEDEQSRYADVADAGTYVEGEVDGGAGDVVADEIEGEEFGCAFALRADGDVGVPLGPLSWEATAEESMPVVGLPSMLRMKSPRRMPAF